ncbi:helix-turn-helix transcriptional regulator [Antrihabitans cavernicola]|uniref:WYL domain-containing protein n=1 Tax=Antrihabitans cavernicola TaxID=2495913 RepID=A0A5A7SJG7_9NOCA|nr:WYL domain-containing protein [Spelaeibacter cavernicola]KAA0024575.1 WYL domain-containing protein [Spelaeibacter cavernicola]
MQKTSARLLALLSLLQVQRDWPGLLLAERLDVSHRTVRRDVDRLRELGYPIAAIKGPDGGYRLEAGKDMPPLLFDDEQAVALAIALQVAVTAGAGIEEGATRALNTIRQVMPARLRNRIDGVRFTAVRRSDTEVLHDVLTTLSSVVRNHEELRFDYGNASEPRRVQPHYLVTQSGRWYLISWDIDRADWRVFRADRITPRIPTGPRFDPRELPGGDVATFLAGRFRGTDGSTSEWPCRGQAVLDIGADVATQFVGDGTVEALGPDRCRVLVGSWSWPALAASFGRFDADIAGVEPAELRTAFADLAMRYGAAGRQWQA